MAKTHPTRDKLEQQQVSAQSKINKYHVKKNPPPKRTTTKIPGSDGFKDASVKHIENS